MNGTRNKKTAVKDYRIREKRLKYIAESLAVNGASEKKEHQGTCTVALVSVAADSYSRSRNGNNIFSCAENAQAGKPAFP